jgi:hypothetical protein
MRANPFLNFHRAAEGASYPALLVVSAFCLALVVIPVALLGLTHAAGALVLAVLGLILAVAVLAGALAAALSDADGSEGRPVGEAAPPLPRAPGSAAR